MDEKKIRQIVREEMKRGDGKSRFGIQSIPFHTHNGVDSPSIFSPTIAYTGFVPLEGDIFDVVGGFTFLPSGWTVELTFGDTTPIYVVTHNLGTNFYSVMVNQTGPNAATRVGITVCFPNYFEVAWINGASFFKEDFHFLLTQVNNKRNALPTYTLSGDQTS